MMKGILIILATFSLLSAEQQAPSMHTKSYFTEAQYEGKDGTVFYKAQLVELVAVGRTQDATHAQSNEEQKGFVERKDFVNHESSSNTEDLIDKKPFAERKDFVSDQSTSNNALLDQKPFAERKDFVNADNRFKFYLTGIGEPNQTIEWIFGNKNLDISYAYISNELYMYKTTTYTLALKPKALKEHSTSNHLSVVV